MPLARIFRLHRFNLALQIASYLLLLPQSAPGVQPLHHLITIPRICPCRTPASIPREIVIILTRHKPWRVSLQGRAISRILPNFRQTNEISTNFLPANTSHLPIDPSRTTTSCLISPINKQTWEATDTGLVVDHPSPLTPPILQHRTLMNYQARVQRHMPHSPRQVARVGIVEWTQRCLCTSVWMEAGYLTDLAIWAHHITFEICRGMREMMSVYCSDGGTKKLSCRNVMSYARRYGHSV
jgi:hypothetical protein